MPQTWPPGFDGWGAERKPTDHDEMYTRTFEWSFQRESFNWELSIPVSTYSYCTNRYRTQKYGIYMADPLQKSFVERLVDRFDSLAAQKGFDELTQIDAIVRFVQSLSYSTDREDTGHRVYPKYAIETLVHGRGDCEDGTILLGTLLYHMGYDVVAMVMPGAGHMLLGVALDEEPTARRATYVEDETQKYFPVETTDTGWDIGQIPRKYRNAGITLQHPDDHPILVHEWNAKPESEGTVTATAHVANFGDVTAENVGAVIEWERQDGGVVHTQPISGSAQTLHPGDSTRYEQTFGLSPRHPIRGKLRVAINGVVHDVSESDYR